MVDWVALYSVFTFPPTAEQALTFLRFQVFTYFYFMKVHQLLPNIIAFIYMNEKAFSPARDG